MATVEFLVDPAHPAFAGHFPGRPILPGVVLLDQVMRVIVAEHAPADADAGVRVAAPSGAGHHLTVCKFHQPAGPGAVLTIRTDPQPSGSIAFTVRHGDALIASGRFASTARPA